MKHLLPFLGLLLFVSTTLPAQQKEILIEDWQRAKAFTLEYLEAMPEEQYDFRPTPEMRTFAEQMLHLTDGNYGLVAMAAGVESPVGMGESEKAEDQSKENVVMLVREGYNFVINALRELDETSLPDSIKMFDRFELSRGRALEKAFEHQTHHRGQATVYLRVAGVEPPEEKLF